MLRSEISYVKIKWVQRNGECLFLEWITSRVYDKEGGGGPEGGVGFNLIFRLGRPRRIPE